MGRQARIVIAALLAGLFATFGVRITIIVWVAFALVGHWTLLPRERSSQLEWAAWLLFAWGTLIGLCVLLVRFLAWSMASVQGRSPRVSLRLPLAVVIGGLAVAAGAGELQISFRNGDLDVGAAMAGYWLWGLFLATVALTFLVLSRERNA